MNLPEYRLKSNTLQRRLGDYLIAENKITFEQLGEAIEYQCIYGGKLGTSLIELGFIDEDYLAQTLSQQLKLHYVKPELLMNIPKNILELVPKEMALKHQVVPYHQDKKKLFVAMRDTSNIAVIDDLSFRLNHIIVPLAIPEVRLMMALKKHYGMDLSPRFINIEAQIKRRSVAAEKSAQPKSEIEIVKEEPQELEDAWPLLGEEEFTAEEEFTTEEDSKDAYFDFSTPSKELSQTSLGQQLIEAKDRNDISQALINNISQDYSGCGLFMVRANAVTGWLAKHQGSKPSGLENLEIPLEEQSIFNMVATSKTHYFGPVIDTPQNRRLLDLFASTPPQIAVAFPLFVGERLISILYIQDDQNTLDNNFVALQKIAQKAEMAFTILILKNKILTT